VTLPPIPLVVVADLSPDGRLDLGRVTGALRGGASAVQVRGKGATARALLDAARAALPLCREAGVPLFVNDRPDVALAAGADGAQVGPNDLPPEAARRVLGSLLLGVSARTPERITAAERARADLLGCGALRASGTKPEAGVIGPEGIAAMAAVTSIPVLAIGGVRPEDAPALRAIGVAGMAVASGVFGASDPERAARAYREAWERAGRRP
jgi:thiamine-phosphate pyrophosphorylase